MQKLFTFTFLFLLASCGDGSISGINGGGGGNDETPTPVVSNFVIASSNDDVGGISNAGSVMIINGATGSQIGATISGDDTNDQLGGSSVTSLGSGYFAISSFFDDVGGVGNAGSVIIIDGTTGIQIGTTIYGDNPGDSVGSSSVTVLD